MSLSIRQIIAPASLLLAGTFLFTSCEPPPNQPNVAVSNANTSSSVNNNQQPSSNSQMSNATNAADAQNAANLPVTLPVLDAMFADENFAADLKSKLNLTDEQIEKLRQAAGEERMSLREQADNGSTAAAQKRADDKIRQILGDKTGDFTRFVRERWTEGETAGSVAGQPNQIPTDTRIVVNAPAYRMDVFKDGRLVRSYKVGIGYPEFPLPTGMRKAGSIIFNPTWTPPDEPWVEGSGKIKAGQKVEAGSKLNPLGPIKIPIGMPSLIHGGKNPARLGTFASHGCVGLTNPQVQDFSLALAQISGTQLTPEDVAGYEKAKTETKNVKLSQTIPVELRYETIVVENGTLKIYRDVYERGTNTEENLNKILAAYGISMENLSEPERANVMDALKQMALDAGGKPVDGMIGNTNSNAANSNTANSNSKSQSGKVTRTIKGKTEIAIPIAALQGKGYPAPVDLNTGGKSGKPLNLAGGNTSNAAANSNQSNTTSAAGRKF